MQKGRINIEIERLGDGKYSINIMSGATAAMVMVACARLLALTENKLSEENRAQFRSEFLRALNKSRQEVVK